MTNNKQSISALRLQRLMGFGSINTAMKWLRKLRSAMGTVVEKHILHDEVEADETSICGVRPNQPGRASSPHRIVGVVERVNGHCGKVRLKFVNGYKDKDVQDAIKETVAPGAIINCDGATAYKDLAGQGYCIDSRVLSVTKGKDKGKAKRLENGKKAVEIHLPLIHRVFSLFKRVNLGAHQGRYSEKHIQSYLDEYCFRFNSRNSKHPLALTRRLIRSVVRTEPQSWKFNRNPQKNPPLTVTDPQKAERIKAWRKLGVQLGGTSGN
jgi:hypothetical protein